MTAPLFAHASEAELARILDYYRVDWQYEPRRFPILWNLDGAVVESFSPDFYLPDLDLYLELTTLKQSLVRKKNRKLRRLRELYPEIRIKLLYARDFRALLLKYGRIDIAASLIGPEGQAKPAEIHAGAAAAVPSAAVPISASASLAGAPSVARPPLDDAPTAASGAEPGADRSPDVADASVAARFATGVARGRGSRRRRGRRRAALSSVSA